MKRISIFKGLLILVLVFMLSINSFAAIVADNDGATFITKAEFDSLKNNFQAQIDNYSTSIDGKIEGAIASYLAGIQIAKTSDISFFDGLGQNVLVYNSNKINDLKWGLNEIDWSWWINIWNSGATSGIVTMTLRLQRVLSDIPADDRDTEAFVLSDDGTKLDYWTDNGRAKLTSTITEQGASGMIGFDNTSTIKARWHGSYGDSGSPNSPPLDNTTLGRSGMRYSRNFASYNSMLWYCSGFNAGVGYSFGHYTKYDRVASANWTASKACTLFMDGTADANALIYNKNLTTDLSQYYLYVGANNDLTLRTTEFTYPSDVSTLGITANGFMRGHVNTTDVLKLTDIDWVKTGLWSDATKTNENYHNWEEVTLDRKARGSSILKQANVPNVILTQFSSVGYYGQVNQGLPVCQNVGPCTIEFTIDLSSLGRSAVVAFKNTPFAINSTNQVINTPLSSGMKLVIDGTNVSTGAKELSNSIHKFKVSFNGEGTNNLFMFVGWPATETTSKRAFFKLPSVCTVTKQD